VELSGKVAVVTGASSGIGEASARALAAAGMAVVAVARRQDRLDALAAADARIVAHAADVTDDAAVRGLADRVRADHGACHVLVNNAGFTDGAHFRGEADLETVRAILDVNLLGALRCTAALADLLVASAPARVVNVASVAGKIGVGPPGYAASKFALVGFTESIRADWARRGVAVTQLNPGFVETEGFPQAKLRGTPLQRLVIGPEEVAAAVVEVARSGARERTVPRWYRAPVALRHLAAPLFWWGLRRAM
jgi:NAD(P)-dependent dehydrogenase (short-subunit alcohol dehydrogenase family)